MAVIDELFLTGVIPVIKIENAVDAVPLAQALTQGGLQCAEITFRTPAAAKALAAIAGSCPHFLVGAGTVLDVATADQAVKSGAKFVVSPGYNAEVVKWCCSNDVPVIPGVSTPSEIQNAVIHGVTVLKLFPIEQLGGIDYLNALSAAFPQVTFIPTGGVNLGNAGSYLSQPCVGAVGGSWLAPANIIAAHDWSAITKTTEQTVQVMHSFEFAHVGINSPDEATCKETAHLWSLFGFSQRETDVAVFTDPPFEVMKYPARGTNGHVAIRCINIERAVRYLQQFGFSAKEDTARKDSRGLSFIYLDKEIGGFAVHLLRK